MEEFIEKLVAKFGVENTIKGLEVLGLIQKDAVLRGDPPPTCAPGYYYNETLKKCVLDIG